MQFLIQFFFSCTNYHNLYVHKNVTHFCWANPLSYSLAAINTNVVKTNDITYLLSLLYCKSKLNFEWIALHTEGNAFSNPLTLKWQKFVILIFFYVFIILIVLLLLIKYRLLMRKRKRSDSVLWQKPLHQQKCQKGKVTTQTTSQKCSIKQRLRTDLGRSVGVTTATQLVWLTGLRAHLPTNRNSRLIKRTHV